MKRIASILAPFALFLPWHVSASTWTIDPDHTSIQFKVKHMMATYVPGVFEKFQGQAEIDENDITKSKAKIVIDTASLDTNVAKRDEHLRSADFFEVDKYPTMTFVSQNIVPEGPGKIKMTGDLTIRGITKRVLIEVDVLTSESKDPWGNFRRGATATTKIYRQDFGLTRNKTLESGGVAVGDEVLITLEVELVKSK